MGSEADKKKNPDDNSATTWLNSVSDSLNTEDNQGYQYPSPPEIPVDTEVSSSPEEDAARKKTESDIISMQQQRIEQQQQDEEDRRQAKWHGPQIGDSSTLSGLQKQVESGEISGADYYLQTAQLFASAGIRNGGRHYAGSKKSEYDQKREGELFGPGIKVDAPGLDRWHNMNPNGAPAAPSMLGDAPVNPGPSMQMKPPWANANSGASKIQTPVLPPDEPVKLNDFEIGRFKGSKGDMFKSVVKNKDGTISAAVGDNETDNEGTRDLVTFEPGRGRGIRKMTKKERENFRRNGLTA